ncbi:MAG: beta-propeller domain-containing protein [Oscillospiraceae bacterium]
MKTNKENQYLINLIKQYDNTILLPEKLQGKNLVNLLDDVKIDEPEPTNGKSSKTTYLSLKSPWILAATFIFVIGLTFYFDNTQKSSDLETAQDTNAAKSNVVASPQPQMAQMPSTSFDDIRAALDIINTQNQQDLCENGTEIVGSSSSQATVANNEIVTEFKSAPPSYSMSATNTLNSFNVYSNDDAYCIDIKDNANDEILGTIKFGKANNFNYLFATETNLIAIYDAVPLTSATALNVDNERIYLDCTTTNVDVIDISQPKIPKEVYTISQEGVCVSATLSDDAFTFNLVTQKSLPSVESKYLSDEMLIPFFYDGYTKKYEHLPLNAISISPTPVSPIYSIKSVIQLDGKAPAIVEACLGSSL